MKHWIVMPGVLLMGIEERVERSGQPKRQTCLIRSDGGDGLTR